jgi:nucleotide-binding universal stress UspA family protein
MPQTLSAQSSISLANILFATDFSRQSSLALKHALPIARKYGSKIYAAHVTREQIGLPAAAREGLQALGVQRRSDTQDDVASLRTELSSIPHEILSGKGHVWAELSKIVEANRIDLIVEGTHGRSVVGRFLKGSVAETIFRRASCPVLTVGPAVSGEPESIVNLHEILFATDFSEISMEALPYAISLAEENHARLYILHVVAKAPSDLEADRLKARLGRLVPEGASLTSRPKTVIEYGSPAERILNFSQELAMDLIVLGVKRAPMQLEVASHLPVGTAYTVVSLATCPVLTVRG